MKLSMNAKARRVLALLLGMRLPRVATALAPYGFSKKDMDEGGRLLVGLTRMRMGHVDAEVDTGLVTRLDEWENKWFPIVSGTLARHFPAQHARVFLNLSQTTGPDVVITVSTMVERLDKLPLPASEGGAGAEGKAALAILAKRGLTAAVLGEARSMIGEVFSIAPGTVVDEAAEDAKDAAALKAMWDWYLEWSPIVRQAVTDRRLLRHMGFLKSNGAPATDEDVDEDLDDEEKPAEPVGPED